MLWEINIWIIQQLFISHLTRNMCVNSIEVSIETSAGLQVISIPRLPLSTNLSTPWRWGYVCLVQYFIPTTFEAMLHWHRYSISSPKSLAKYVALYLTEEQSWGSESEATCPGVTESKSVQDFLSQQPGFSVHITTCTHGKQTGYDPENCGENGSPLHRLPPRPPPRSAASPGTDAAPGGRILPKRLLQFPAAFCFPDKWQDPADH